MARKVSPTRWFDEEDLERRDGQTIFVPPRPDDADPYPDKSDHPDD